MKRVTSGPNRNTNPTPVIDRVVANADRKQVVEALRRTLENGVEWPDFTNHYMKKRSDKIRSSRRAIETSDALHFADYLSMSAFLHCSDSLGYFGRAMSALMSGNVEIAGHLFYYAELRAGASLLAAEGIYVGDFYNTCLQSGGKFVWSGNQGTHAAMWDALNHWSQGASAEGLFGRVIRPAQRQISEWMSASSILQGGATSPAVNWIVGQAGMDLKRYTGDRKFRNFLSYEIHPLSTANQLAEACAIVAEIWDLLEPDTRGGFPLFDLQILGNTLHSQYVASPSLHEKMDWADWVDSVVALGPPDRAVTEMLKNFPKGQGSTIFGHALKHEPSYTEILKTVRGMAGRALFLVRLAIGASRSILTDSGGDEETVHAWVDSLCVARGLWSEGDKPEKLDLWDDLSLDLESAVNASNGKDGRMSLAEVAPAVSSLSLVERVLAWSI